MKPGPSVQNNAALLNWKHKDEKEKKASLLTEASSSVFGWKRQKKQAIDLCPVSLSS